VFTQQRAESEPLPQRGCDQQSGIGHAVLVIGSHIDAVERARLRHQEGAPLDPADLWCGNRDRAGQEHPLGSDAPDLTAYIGDLRLSLDPPMAVVASVTRRV
jgi:hypothetical protein